MRRDPEKKHETCINNSVCRLRTWFCVFSLHVFPHWSICHTLSAVNDQFWKRKDKSQSRTWGNTNWIEQKIKKLEIWGLQAPISGLLSWFPLPKQFINWNGALILYLYIYNLFSYSYSYSYSYSILREVSLSNLTNTCSCICIYICICNWMWKWKFWFWEKFLCPTWPTTCLNCFPQQQPAAISV